jgi:hypothetical protein
LKEKTMSKPSPNPDPDDIGRLREALSTLEAKLRAGDLTESELHEWAELTWNVLYRGDRLPPSANEGEDR